MPNDAINTISVFGKMLRSILYKQGSNTSTIKEELDFIKSYFEIENLRSVSYTHLRAHETVLDLVCRLLLEKKKSNELHI